ncbi:MAG TPA: DUF2993 domain-containing protein [Actinomycetota bacterium]|nr:DUF2993 domain-containing protein [Actinomycetota bacterium]
MRRDYPRVPGPGRAIITTLLVLAALFVGADVALRAYVEGRVAGAVQTSLGLPVRPDLDLHGFPFSLSFFRGRFDEVAVTVSDVEVDGLRLDRVVLRLADVRFAPREMLTGSAHIRSQGGTGEAEVGEDALTAFVQDHDAPVEVRLLGPNVRVSTRVIVGEEETAASATGPLRLEGDTLVFDPQQVDLEGSVGIPAQALAFAVELPELIPGVRYDDVVVDEGTATLEADLAGARLDLAA